MRGAVLLNNSHIITPATVSRKTDTSTFVLPKNFMWQSALKSWSSTNCTTESSIDPLSQVSIKHKTANLEQSLVFPINSWSSSILLPNELMFPVVEYGGGGDAGAYRLAFLSYSVSLHEPEWPDQAMNDGNKSSGVVALMFISSSLV